MGNRRLQTSAGHHFVGFTEDDYERYYCNLCENGMQVGMVCDFCGIMIDTGLCLHSVSTTVPCKTIARCSGNGILHHWVCVRYCVLFQILSATLWLLMKFF